MAEQRRQRLVNLIPRLWRWVHEADITTDRGRSRLAKVGRWLRRNGLVVEG